MPTGGPNSPKATTRTSAATPRSLSAASAVATAPASPPIRTPARSKASSVSSSVTNADSRKETQTTPPPETTSQNGAGTERSDPASEPACANAEVEKVTEATANVANQTAPRRTAEPTMLPARRLIAAPAPPATVRARAGRRRRRTPASRCRPRAPGARSRRRCPRPRPRWLGPEDGRRADGYPDERIEQVPEALDAPRRGGEVRPDGERLDPAERREPPQPRRVPWVESPRVRGRHLRGGPPT